MRTILVDAVNTFVLVGQSINTPMQQLLDKYPNKKIIVTNADDEQFDEFGLHNMPYQIYTMKHRPDKSNPMYFRSLMQYFGITADNLIYFEHNLDAIASARSLGITTYHYDKNKRDLLALKRFLDQNQ